MTEHAEGRNLPDMSATPSPQIARVPDKSVLFSTPPDQLAQLRRLQASLVASNIDDPRVQVDLANVTAAIRHISRAAG